MTALVRRVGRAVEEWKDVARDVGAFLEGVPERLGLRGPATVVVGAMALAAVAAGAWVASAALGTFEPGSGVGYGFGVAAAVALGATMLYSVRRGLTRVRSLGPTRTYLQLHLWSGGLFALLFLLHTGFRAPEGVFTTLLWATAAWTAGTGAVGILLQRTVPGLLRRATSFEVHLRRIPGLVDELRERAEAAADDAGARVERFHRRRIAPELAGPRFVVAELLGEPGGIASDGAVQRLRGTLAGESEAALDELCEIHDAKREMDVHYTLQKVLRGWLYLHLPAAVALLGLVALHVFFVTYF